MLILRRLLVVRLRVAVPPRPARHGGRGWERVGPRGAVELGVGVVPRDCARSTVRGGLRGRRGVGRRLGAASTPASPAVRRPSAAASGRRVRAVAPPPRDWTGGVRPAVSAPAVGCVVNARLRMVLS